MFLVTGITGLTGRFLFNEIEKDNKIKELKCFIRKNSDISWMKNMPEFCYGDISNIDSLVECMKNVNGVIHLVNIRYSPQIIEACKRSGVKRVIFVNTTGMYSKYQIYSDLYRKLEEKILYSDLDYTIIRPTMIYGNNLDKNIHKLVKILNILPIFPVIGNGKPLMQPIYAGDLAKVIYTSFKNEKAIRKEYNVAGKKPLTYLSLLEEITACLKKRPLFFYVPYFIALFLGKLGDYIPNGLVNMERVLRLSEDKVFDYSEAKRDLNFSPLSFQEGIRLEVESLRISKVIH